MKTKILRFGSVEVRAPVSWRDVTNELGLSDLPFTLGDDLDGAGALQFSLALHGGGPSPNPSPDDLMGMVVELAQEHGLAGMHDKATDAGQLRIASASYRSGEDFFRIWYVSDGENIAKVTYTCEWGRQDEELPECEAIVRSLRVVA